MNEVVSQFNSDSLNGERFRCLLFLLGLRPYKYAEIHPRIFTLLHRDPQMEIYDLADEYKKYPNLMVDSNLVKNDAGHSLEVNQ